MTDVVSKASLFAGLGYAGSFDALDRALEDAGLSRAGKPNIAVAKAEAVRDVLAGRFVIVCTRGDCRAEAQELADERAMVAASSPAECAVCGGSANARAVDRMVGDMHAAGLARLCVVGGSPNAREELQRLVAGRVEVKTVDGTAYHARADAQANLAWADRVALWGGTILAHRVSALYRGAHVIQLARRSIQELARAVSRSTRPPPPSS